MYKFFGSLLGLGLMIVPLIFFCSKKTESQPAQQTSSSSTEAVARLTQPTREAKKLALLVGINKYKYYNDRQDFSNLVGSVNDVMEVKTLLIGKYNFQEKDISVLLDEKATHAAIVDSFQKHLIDQAQRDDIVVFHFSGHGSQVTDISGDEPDGWDETIVPHDTRDPQGKVFDIIDDEMNDLIDSLAQKTKNISLIFDCCHSGTPTRGAGQVRKIPRDTRQPPRLPQYTRRKRGTRGAAGDLRESENYVLISGCLSNQNAFEHFADGKEHGALTYFFVRELENAKTARRAVTYKDVMDNVIRKVNSAYPAQLPQLEGALADDYVFSDSTNMAQPYILADPNGADRVTLKAGAVQGMTAGSLFMIYKPGVKQFQAPEKPIAEVKLIEVGDFEATGLITNNRQIDSSSRAVEYKHHYADRKLRVYFDGLANSSTLQTIRARLQEHNHVAELPQMPVPRNYQLLLRQAQNRIVIEGGDTTQISPPVAMSDPNVVERLVKQVTDWAKWFHVLAIENKTSALNIQFSLAGSGNQMQERVIKAGDIIECTIKNASAAPVYITLLDLSSNGSVEVVYPKNFQVTDALAAGETLTRKLKMTVPPGRNSIKDILKVFATTQPVDFSFMKQAAIRGRGPQSRSSANDPLVQLLENAALGKTRGSEDVTLEGWTTTARSFIVKQP